MAEPCDRSTQLRDAPHEVVFTRLLVSNQSALYGFLFSLVHDRSAADDLLQDLATRLWNHFGDYDPSRPFVAWGLGFARLLVMEWRRKQLRLPLPLEDSTLLALADRADERAQHHEERRDALRECLKSLTPLQRKTLHSRYEQETSVTELAARTKRSEMAVYKVLKRAHEALLACINQTLGLGDARSEP
jgi:RNA polymerase sigma-70 factor (ECF subfamily)